MAQSKKEGKLLEIKYEGDAHTVLNLLKRKLLDNKEVTFVGYNKPHPLKKESVLVLRTKKEDPKKVVKDTINNVVSELKEAVLK